MSFGTISSSNSVSRRVKEALTKCCCAKCLKETLNERCFLIFCHHSGEGSHQSGGSEDRTPGAMARAITVHADTKKVMYFA